MSQATNENTKEFNKHIVTRQGVVAPAKSETTGVFKNTCIFCNKTFLYFKRKKYGLIQVGTVEVQNRIVSCINILDDTEMRRKIADLDFVAKEVKYHQVCRVFYDNKARKQVARKRKQKITNWKKERDAHKKCLQILKDFILSEIIEKYKVFYFKDIREYYLKHYQDILRTESIVSNSRVMFLQGKILKLFPEQINFRKCFKKNVIYNKNTSFTPDALVYLADKSNTKLNLQKAAHLLRKEIFKIEKKPLPQDLNVKHIFKGECDIPENLKHFLQHLLIGPKNLKEENTKDIKVLSMAEDVIYSVTNGSIKPAKLSNK